MRKNNKRALIVSALSLLLCVSMLVGSTMAWFTDNATAKVNTIEAGTLDIDIVDKDGNSLAGQTMNFNSDNKEIKWEPGCTYELNEARIINKGNLWLKFKLSINVTGDTALANVIDVYQGEYTGTDADVCLGTLAKLMTDEDGAAYGTLAPQSDNSTADESKAYQLSLHMRESAGNEYQGLKLDNISFTVQATQYTKEMDSITDQYDANAEFDELVIVPADKTQLGDAIANIPADKPVTIPLPALPSDDAYILPGKEMTGKDVTFTGTKETVVDLTKAVTASGASVTFEGITVKSGTNLYQGIHHAEKVVYKDCTLDGTVFLYSDADFVDCTFNITGDNYNIWTYGNNANFSNCTFNCSGKAILVYNERNVNATVSVNNCTFNDKGEISGKAAIEVGESANGAKATYNIYVNGCTVNGFDVTGQNASTFGGTDLGTTVWGNKNLMPADRLNVVIDGVDVY